MGQPTNEQLERAYVLFLQAPNILLRLRDERSTWYGIYEIRLRGRIDSILSSEY